MTKTRVKTMLFVLGSLLVANAALSAPPTPPSREVVTIDCAFGEDLLGTNDQVLMPGETITVTLLNCFDWNIEDNDAGDVMEVSATPTNNFDVPNNSFVFVVTGAADIDFDPPGGWTEPPTWIDTGSSDIDLDVYLAVPAETPAGELLLERELVFAESNLPQFSVGSTVANEGDYLLGGDAECTLENGYHVYQTFTIAATEASTYTFRVPWVTPVDEDLYWGAAYYPSQDFFLAVYTAFDPTAPEENLVGCNDDRTDPDEYVSVGSGSSALIADDQAPSFTVALQPGNYTLMLATYRSISTASYNAGEFSSTYAGNAYANWIPIAMSAFFELWGPAGAIIPDTDNDGVPDDQDAFPNDPSRWLAAVAVHVMPVWLLGVLFSGLGWAGRRKLR